MSVLRLSLLPLAGLLLLTACGSDVKTEATYPDSDHDRIYRYGSLSGSEGIALMGRGHRQKEEDSGIGVNSFLWRGALDTVSFMPLASADPFGGVIMTDWYSPAQTPAERTKVQIYVLARELRADAIRATVFRQVKGAGGAWVDAPVAADSGTKLENAILSRARELRQSNMGL